MHVGGARQFASTYGGVVCIACKGLTHAVARCVYGGGICVHAAMQSGPHVSFYFLPWLKTHTVASSTRNADAQRLRAMVARWLGWISRRLAARMVAASEKHLGRSELGR